MYRLMLYVLLAITGYGVILSSLGVLPYSALMIILVGMYLSVVCYVSNNILARLFNVTTNPESQFITALILTLILGPLPLLPNIVTLTVVGVLAMASKYMIVWKKRHIFNPAAFGAVVSALIFSESASWWGGSTLMIPVVIIGGLVLLYRIKRWNLVGTFLALYVILTIITRLLLDGNVEIALLIQSLLFVSPIIFFSVIMLVEPSTSPTTRSIRFWYAVVTASILLAYQTYTSLPYSLELALLTGNLFSRFIHSDPRYILRLKEKKEIAANTIQFLFEADAHISHKAGQFLEWTLPHHHPDNRGIRRFFTIASSPTEPYVMLATRIGDRSSSFKAALHNLKAGDTLSASNLEGEFTLPRNVNQKLVFIAGGIGITPFRSMIQFLHDTGEKRDIILFYSNKTKSDIAFHSLFDTATNSLGLKVVYTITDDIPKDWRGRTGFINPQMIVEEVPDYKKRVFYISGPEPMVEAFEKMIATMGIADSAIKRDFFPGYTETHQTPNK